MKFYTQADFEQSKAEKKRELIRLALCALPFLAASIAGFVIRNEILCAGCCIAFFSVIVFLYDLRLQPALRYGRHLKEIHSGISHQTLGALTHLGSDPVYMDGIDFHEVIINIYEDLAEEGERRFLLDVSKTVPEEWMNQDVIVTSHGNYLLEAVLAQEVRAANKEKKEIEEKQA